VLSLLLLTPFLANAAISDGQTAYYTFDQSSENLTDATGNGNTATNHNTTTFAAGIIGNGALLQETTPNYFSMSDSTSWAFGTGDFTISAWVKFNSFYGGSNQAIYSQSDGSSNNRIRVEMRNNGSGDYQAAFFAEIGGSVVADYHTPDGADNAFTSTGTWYNVVWVRSGTTLTAYINGVANTQHVGTAIGSSSLGDISGSAYLGIENEGSLNNALDGTLDEVGVWNRALTPTEITAIYNSGVGCQYPYGACSGESPSSTASTTTVDNPVQDLYDGFMIFFITCGGVIWFFRRRI